MSDTPRLALPLLAAGQAQKHVTHNDALVRLDALIQLAVQSRSQAAPPLVPTELTALIVPAGGSGVFSGRTDQLALYEDGGWTFLVPRPGWQAWVGDEAELQVFTGTQWRRASPLSAQGAELWGVNATADATNRLVVSAPASLFNHAGGDHRLTINKGSAGATASPMFQAGFSGRAEFGLAGDDDLRMKVSPDGGAWTEALVVERATGRVSLPASAWARDVAQPNLLVNADFQVNQRGFGGGTLAAGAYGFDRWKAAVGGANATLSGFALTLASGKLVQPVEPALWGVASFASTPLTLSVENLGGGALQVGLGSATGTIAAGSGRRSLTLTPASGDTGPLPVTLAPAAGAVTFGRVKLEAGAHATPWEPRPAPVEQGLCQRYHWRPGATLTLDAYHAAGQRIRQAIVLPTRMRATPAVAFTASAEVNIAGSDRGVVVLSPGLASAEMVAAATGRVSVQLAAIAFDAEL